ncbi:MAG: uncharacterized protein A8A55_2084 [Amphiamblys sp. WSBS2006]|nr:MAG: uncharacterized protein A8A55_2084 [Amphiamblys sp. WSBS2006]
MKLSLRLKQPTAPKTRVGMEDIDSASLPQDTSPTLSQFLLLYTVRARRQMATALEEADGSISIEKKRQLFVQFITQRNQGLKLLVLVRWLEKNEGYFLALSGHRFLLQTQTDIGVYADRLYASVEQMKHSAGDRYDVERAVEILSCSSHTLPSYLSKYCSPAKRPAADEIRLKRQILDIEESKRRRITVENRAVVYRLDDRWQFSLRRRSGSWGLVSSLAQSRRWESLEEGISAMEEELALERAYERMENVKKIFRQNRAYTHTATADTLEIEKHTAIGAIKGTFLLRGRRVLYSDGTEQTEIDEDSEIEGRPRKSEQESKRKFFCDKKAELSSVGEGETVEDGDSGDVRHRFLFGGGLSVSIAITDSHFLLQTDHDGYLREEKHFLLRTALDGVVEAKARQETTRRIEELCAGNKTKTTKINNGETLLLRKENKIIARVHLAGGCRVRVQHGDGTETEVDSRDEAFSFLSPRTDDECSWGRLKELLRRNKKEFLEKEGCFYFRQTADTGLFRVARRGDGVLLSGCGLDVAVEGSEEDVLRISERVLWWKVVREGLGQSGTPDAFPDERTVRLCWPLQARILLRDDFEIVVEDSAKQFAVTATDIERIGELGCRAGHWIGNCLKVFEGMASAGLELHRLSLGRCFFWREAVRVGLCVTESECVIDTASPCETVLGVAGYGEESIRAAPEEVVDVISRHLSFVTTANDFSFFVQCVERQPAKFELGGNQVQRVFHWGVLSVASVDGEWVVFCRHKNKKMESRLCCTTQLWPNVGTADTRVAFESLVAFFSLPEDCLDRVLSLLTSQGKSVSISILLCREKHPLFRVSLDGAKLVLCLERHGDAEHFPVALTKEGQVSVWDEPGESASSNRTGCILLARELNARNPAGFVSVADLVQQVWSNAEIFFLFLRNKTG